MAGLPSAWILQNSSHYIPLTILDFFHVPYTLKTAVILQCLHQLFAMTGMYILSLLLGSNKRGSLVAAILYGVGGATFFSAAPYVDIVRGVSWLPWTLMAILPLSQSLSRNTLSVTLALLFKVVVLHQFLVSSYPGIILATFPIFFFIALLAHIFPPAKTTKKSLKFHFFLLSTAVVITVLLSAPKYLPFIDIIQADKYL